MKNDLVENTCLTRYTFPIEITFVLMVERHLHLNISYPFYKYLFLELGSFVVVIISIIQKKWSLEAIPHSFSVFYPI